VDQFLEVSARKPTYLAVFALERAGRCCAGLNCKPATPRRLRGILVAAGDGMHILSHRAHVLMRGPLKPLCFQGDHRRI